MRYYYKKPKIYMTIYGETYECDHPVYNKCTLFKMEGKGLAVIQQRYDKKYKNNLVGCDRSVAYRLFIFT